MYPRFSLIYIIIHSCGMSERRHWFADIMAITMQTTSAFMFLPPLKQVSLNDL